VRLRLRPLAGHALAVLAGILAVAALLALVAPAGASGPIAGTIAVGPAVAPAQPGDALTAAATGLPWKVVYVVGDVDDGGPLTQQRVSQAHANAEALRALGMQVVEFTPPDNSWQAIKAEAADAHVLIYTGHGVYWGSDAALVGGFVLTDQEWIHPDRIRDELRLRPNAIVIINHACYSAGQSSLDAGPISMQEAQRRVALYSRPFLQAGFAAYYASNYYGAPVYLLTEIAAGRTLEQAYQSHFAFSPDLAVRSDHPELPRFTMWVDQDPGDAGPEYNHAFVGLPGATAADLFQRVTIRPATAALTVLVQLGDQRPRTVELPLVADPPTPVRWSASLIGGAPWLSVQTTQGLTGEPVALTLTPPVAMGEYCADLLVTSDDPLVTNPSFTVPICLRTAQLSYLPLARN